MRRAIIWTVVLFVGHALDIVLTYVLLQTGNFFEANPLTAWFIGNYGVLQGLALSKMLVPIWTFALVKLNKIPYLILLCAAAWLVVAWQTGLLIWYYCS